MNATMTKGGACSTCGEIHGDEGHPDSWPAWTDQLAYALAIPEDGEGRGLAGEDLGPCDPADED